MFTKADYSLSPFFELSQDYLCIAGYDGYFKDVNPAFVDMIGYSKEELLSLPINELIFDSDKKRTEEFRKNLKKGIPLLNFENRYIKKSGEMIWLTWTSMPVESEQLVYAIAKNITHIKKQEEDRKNLITDLTNLNKELTQLSYTTTHDLKSPVNNLISLFNLLDIEEIKNKDNLLYVDMLKQSAKSLKVILNNYIDVFTQRSESIMGAEEINLTKTVKSTIEPIKYWIESTNTTIETDFSEIDCLKFNSFYLQSIIMNLISNSIKYARPGIPPVIRIKSRKTFDTIQVSFEDNGLGFQLEEVKDRLFKLNETFHDHSESKGVGLYLIKNYMEAMGGNVCLKSEINQGSTFTLTFRA